MTETKSASRPLSPHLQIYRPVFTMMMSIVHRITGMALYLGMALLAIWLGAAALSDSSFAMVQSLFSHWLSKLVLVGFTWALIHHALGGLRHLIWDTGRGFELAQVEWMARANLAGSLLLTAALWVAGYGVWP